MREICEFRVAEEFAAQLFGPEEGERLGFIRKVRLESIDPRLHLVGRIHTELIAGDLLGLGLLSELSIRSHSFGDSDVALTRQFVGVRRGLLRPRRLMVVSQRVRQLLMVEKVRSVDVQIARLVD